MLKELHIENIAVIKNTTVDFSKGLTVMTGETGAGKSIIIDSVNLLMGSRSSRELIRNGETHALVSACFSDIPKKAENELSDMDVFTEDNQIYIQRTIAEDGKTQARINGRSVPLSTLKEVGRLLLNIHGQHDNQMLLNPHEHINFLDSYANISNLKAEYSSIYSEMNLLRKKLSEKTKSQREISEKSDILNYQINEIDAAKLKPGEENELAVKRLKIKNIEKVTRYAKEAAFALSSGEQNQLPAFQLLKNAALAIEKLDDVLPNAYEMSEKLTEYMYEVQDIGEQVSSLLDGESENPEKELDRIENRLETISRLQKKYGPEVKDILEFRNRAKIELEELMDSENIADSIKKELSKKAKDAYTVAEKITEARKNAAKKLSDEVCSRLKFLDLEKVRFSVTVKDLVNEKGIKKFSPNGCDEIEFMISTNPGEPLKPLSKIASGGELARVMLALKNVLAENDEVATLIFDEIDTGVSGKTSQKIGMLLRDIGKYAQVICITHSAQIASISDNHLKIEKNEHDGRVATTVSQLNFNERVSELSRIMGGIEISESIINSAKEMLINNGITDG